MKAFIARLIDLRPGEAPLLLKSALTLFGLIAAHTMLETARDALFLKSLPASRLTFVYFVLAGLALGVSSLNSRFVTRFGRRNALIFTLFAAAYGTTVLFLFEPTKVVVFVLYAWSGLLGSVMIVQFWMFAGQTFTVAQGKRLFGPMTAGGVLGAVVGASVSVGALRWLDVHQLLAVGAVVLLLTAVLLTTVPVDDPTFDNPEPSPIRPRESKSIIALFRSQPYLLRLAGLIALSTATLLTTDYLFKSVASRHYSGDELGSFFATYYAVLNSAALLVQLFVAGAIVRRAGVIAAFSVLPVLLLLGSVGTVLVGGVLIAVLITKGVEGSLRHSLHRIASELLWMPLPDAVRTKSKVIVDTVFVRGAQAVTAGGLLLLATFGYDHPRVLGLILGVLALAWLVVAMGLRRSYLALFRDALRRASPETLETQLELDIRSVEVVVEALSSREPERAIAAIDLLVANRRRRLIPALILYHESEEVLERALPAVGTADRKDWIPLAERLLEHQNPTLRIASLRALAGAGVFSAIERRLLDIDPRVRAYAAFWLAHPDDGDVRKNEGVQQILAMTDESGASAKVGLLQAIASSGDEQWSDVILDLSNTEHPRIMEAVVLAMANVHDERFITPLIERLRFRQHRVSVRDAIVTMGDAALDKLVEALDDPATDHRVVRHIPRTISRFGTQRAADILTSLLIEETPGRIRYKVIRGLGRLVAENIVEIDRTPIERRIEVNLVEYLRMMSLAHPLEDPPAGMDASTKAGRQLLVGLLKDKSDQALERAFRLLQIVHRDEDLHSVSYAVDSADRRMRAQALEYLDALTLDAKVPAIRELFRIVVDDLPTADRLSRAAHLLPKRPTNYTEAITMLLREVDLSIANIAGYHALQLGIRELRDDVIAVSNERPRLASLRAMVEALVKLEGTPTVA